MWNIDISWFRFRLPLGSALLLVGIVDVAMNFTALWLDYGAGLVLNGDDDVTLSVDKIMLVGFVVTWTIVNVGLLWFGIVKKSRAALVAWIVTTCLECTCVSLIWFLAMYRHWVNWVHFVMEIYYMSIYVVVNGYILYVGFQFIREMRENNPLDPIGLGFMRIFKFYLNDASLGTKLLLTTELVLIAEYLFIRQVFLLGSTNVDRGHEGDRSAAIIAEEFVMRAIRFIISSVGLYLLSKGNIGHLKSWCFAYFGATIASLGIFMYLLIMWNAGHAVFTVGYYLMFLASLLLRFSVLFFCWKVIEPFTSTTVPYVNGIEVESRSPPPPVSVYSH